MSRIAWNLLHGQVKAPKVCVAATDDPVVYMVYPEVDLWTVFRQFVQDFFKEEVILEVYWTLNFWLNSGMSGELK